MKPVTRQLARAFMAGLLGLLIQSEPHLQAQPIPTPVADYTFQNTLSSSIGSAPALNHVGGGSNLFATETVNGTSRTVLQFPIGNGLQVPTTGLIANDTYTIVVFFRFTEVSGYRKIIDVANRESDDGLYNLNSTLNYYPESSSSATPIQPDQYVQVVLTRDQSGTVKGYVDGVERVSFNDTGGIGIITAADALHFFIDDNDTSDEHAAGAVARIRLYNTVLTTDQIQTLAPLGSTILAGDANNDGKLSILDIIQLVRITVGTNPAPADSTDDFARTDANKDGQINIVDIIFTINKILGISHKPVNSRTATATVQLKALNSSDYENMMVPVQITSELPVSGIQMTLAYEADRMKPGRPVLMQPDENVVIESNIQAGRLQLVVYGMAGPLNREDPSFSILVPIEWVRGASSLTLTDLLVADRWAQVVQPVVVTSTVKIQTTPTSFELGTAYPNPFNPQTQIAYALPDRAHVRLTIYNLLGQEVVRLVDRVQPAGHHTITWDGRNTQRATIASGVYLYRIETDSGFQATRRVTLLK